MFILDIYNIDKNNKACTRSIYVCLFSADKNLQFRSLVEKSVNSTVHFVSALSEQYSNAHNRGGKSRKIEIRNAWLVLELRNLDDNAQIKSDAEIPGVNRIHGTRSVPEAYNYRAQAFNIELAASEGFL